MKVPLDGKEWATKVWHFANQSPPGGRHSANYRQSVMIFAGIAHDFKSDVYFVDETQTGEGYVALIEQFYKDASNKKPGIKFILWQDNAPVHKAKMVIKKLKELSIETKLPKCRFFEWRRYQIGNY
ncbi:MAG: hypothetical protein EZS28_041303 [Streblomastix strix]|uniref:Tc1-like transposase DDE domain-containing protein n=1 Tax=Streblomastix strix TaxID=222440 RepID=A0A5J4TZR8_9EUKA|nr:MAG: hypothetical protein EZS28_041303 [Streblomastix strix]